MIASAGVIGSSAIALHNDLGSEEYLSLYLKLNICIRALTTSEIPSLL